MRFGATINSDINCNGVYSLHETLFASIIAVNQLPVINETLWLRVLGKGKVQRNAVDELLALPDTNEQVRKLPVEQLEQLAVALMDFSTVDDLQQWLESRQKPVKQE